MTTRTDGGAEACRVLGLDPQRVSHLGFGIDATGKTTAEVSLVLDDDELDRLLDALRGI